MKKFMDKMLKAAKNFKLWDYSILKISVMVFGLWLATVIPALTTVNAWIYAVIWVVTMAYLVWKMLKK